MRYINAMRYFFKKFLRKKTPAFILKTERDPSRYEWEKTQSLKGDYDTRMRIAKSRHTHQEILYYMVEHDPDPGIREVVARNLATPIQASEVISRDKSADVRIALAERLVRLLPELTQEEHSHLYAIAVQALGTLAMDEVLNVRIALSSALKDHAYAPPSIAAQLARDVERQVAEPMLRFCAALPDDVLLDILKNTENGWAREAIAGRRLLSGDLSASVIQTNDAPAGRTLIANPTAQISLTLLRDIIDRARQLPEWQEPLALRKGLPPEMALSLAEFAQDSVRKILIKRGDFDRVTRNEINKAIKRRLGYAAKTENIKQITQATPYDRAVAMARAGTLNETIVTDALAMHETDFAIAAIACMARISLADVRRVLGLQSARPIVALSWKAGLSMRTALLLQKTLGRVPAKDLLYPRDGTDYPLSEEELIWQIEFLGFSVAS